MPDRWGTNESGGGVTKQPGIPDVNAPNATWGDMKTIDTKLNTILTALENAGILETA